MVSLLGTPMLSRTLSKITAAPYANKGKFKTKLLAAKFLHTETKKMMTNNLTTKHLIRNSVTVSPLTT